MSRTDLAGETGITSSAVSQVVTGTSTSFSAANHERAARALGVDAYWLATGDGAMDHRPGSTEPSELQPNGGRSRTPFGNRMCDARAAAKLTQFQVCERLGIAQSTLADLERTANGSAFTAQLARLYGVDPYWLATGEGEMDLSGLTERAIALGERGLLSRRARELGRLFDSIQSESEKARCYAIALLLLAPRNDEEQQPLTTVPHKGKAPARIRLRDFLRRKIADKRRGASYKEIVAEGKISNGRLGRLIDDGGENTRLATLDDLAEFFKVEPWELLHPVSYLEDGDHPGSAPADAATKSQPAAPPGRGAT